MDIGRKRLTRRDIICITFFFGFFSAIAQVLLVRELLSVFRGNEFIIGMVFAAWFLGIYAGARFNPPAPRAALEKRLLLSLLMFPPLIPAIVYGAHLLPFLLPATAGTYYPLSLEFSLAFLCTVPASVPVGYFFPPAATLLAGEDGAASGGLIFTLESLGAFAGGAAFSFLFVDLMNPLALSALCGGLALILYGAARGKTRVVPLVVLPLLLLLCSGRLERSLFSSLWGARHAGVLADYGRTRYQTVQIESFQDQVNVYGNGSLYYSFPDRHASRALFHLVQSLRRGENERVLMLGGGAGSLAFNLLKMGVGRLSYCETDAGLWDRVSRARERFYPGLTEDKRFTVIKEDFKYYLSRAGERFDLILCLSPPPENTMLNRFYTREFYALARERLSPRGVFITSLHGFSNYMSADRAGYIASVYRGFASLFPCHLATSGETVFLVGAAAKGVLPENPETLINRYGTTHKRWQNRGLEREVIDRFHPDELRMLFEPTQLAYFHSRMAEHARRAAPNTELRPTAYWRHMLLSALQEESSISGVFRYPFIFPALCLCLTLVGLAEIRRRGGKALFRGAVVVFAMGFVSISAVLAMMLLYQSFYGVVYHRVALVNALYMLGLAAGSHVATRRHVSLRVAYGAIILVLGMMLVYTTVRNEALFWALILALSALCGTVFPSLFKLLAAGEPHRAASMLDSMDHFGAIVGSLLTAMTLIPFLGLYGTLIAALAVAFCAFIFIGAAGPGNRGSS